MHKKMITVAMLGITSLQFASCITVAPVHATYEKAATLGKGNIELAGNFSHYLATDGGETESINRNVGFRAGYGLSDKVDVKLRYEKLMVIHQEPGSQLRANYLAVIPKVNLLPGKFSLFVPLSTYAFSANSDNRTYTSRSYSIAPHMIRTFTNQSNKVDFSTSTNLEYIFSTGESEPENHFLVGVNIGAGFSSNLDKWAIRPEIGMLTKPAETGIVWHLGVGLQVLFPTRKKAY